MNEIFCFGERAIGELILYLGMNACYHSLFCLERIYPFHVLMLLCNYDILGEQLERHDY